ncbi:MAG: hypothetical protein IJA27_08865 [Lachnospiraceae bacterium]|nr:hypothetical protein [Lachnospiraceae bacterium]
MTTIICPNCGKETINDDKCRYCNYLLKKNSNPYNSEKYQYLKGEYIKSNNKAAAIKNGMNHFGISMQEAKKIVDFIADELYGEQVIRSKEQVAELLDEDEPESVRIKREKYNARTSKIYKIIGCISLIVTAVSAFLLITVGRGFESRTSAMVCCVAFVSGMLGCGFSMVKKKKKVKNYYTFSFPAYFIHVMMYQIIAEVLLYCSILLCKDYGITREYPLVVLVWYVLEIVLAIYIFGKLCKNWSSFFSTEPGRYQYGYRRPTPDGNPDHTYHQNWRASVCYEILTITKVEEHFRSFVIYGNIKVTDKKLNKARMVKSKNNFTIKKLKVPKNFRDNKELIEKLRKRIK